MSAARPVDVPFGLTASDLPIYMQAYLKARQKGKSNAKARQAGIRAVKAARKKDQK